LAKAFGRGSSSPSVTWRAVNRGIFDMEGACDFLTRRAAGRQAV
jgi:hypothetical protein